MLRRIIGEDIAIVFKPGPALGRVLADRSQIEQVIMNLAVNARDAMPQGGRLTIETSNEEIDGVYALTNPDNRPGPHVRMRISDTGCGMTEDVREHLFEPFFTTKGQGKGTGLGLATVYGIVRQSRGDIYVDSAPGRGTTFTILLPITESLPRPDQGLSPNAVAGGSETILLVEDDEIVHRFADRILRTAGYEVLATRGPEEALRVCAERRGQVSLMLTDLVMPVMHGYALAERARKLRPGMRLLFMSGYADAELKAPAGLETVPCIEKPLTAAALLGQVRRSLDAKA